MLRTRKIYSTAILMTHPFQYRSITNEKIDFNFGKILILQKITRFEYEKSRFPELSETELKTKLEKRGSSFERLIEHHNTHYKSLERIINCLNKYNIETKVTQRRNYTPEDIDWCDCVLTAGGDGTFLSAAAKVFNNKKPVLGINTDVTSSEGHLLLPKKHSINFEKSFKKILKGDFSWHMRARISITFDGKQPQTEPVELHDQFLSNLEHRDHEHVEENRTAILRSKHDKIMTKNVNKYHNLALNEIFIGESLSARVSYYQMSIDDGPFFKQKSSGIILCTGTGSTSWCYNINKMSLNSMKKIVKIIKNELDDETLIPDKDGEFIQSITNKFNDSIVFEPDELRMSYTVRDPIINRIFNNETNRGFAKKIVVRSRCFDACLVIDGGSSYQFNDGAKATLEILPENSLRTIILKDD